MTQEIERKFVAGVLPDPAGLGPGERLRQGYIAEEGDVVVRIRISDKGARLTIKAGAGMTRTEVEVELSADEAETLWPHTSGRRIAKTRYRILLDPSDNYVAEVDVYEGDLVGLCTVEVEFANEDAARAFEPPRWFGREVTGQHEWTNAALARGGLPG